MQHIIIRAKYNFIQYAVFVGVFVIVSMLVTPVYAQYSYDYGGADYNDYTYTPVTYDYGGADYNDYTYTPVTTYTSPTNGGGNSAVSPYVYDPVEYIYDGYDPYVYTPTSGYTYTGYNYGYTYTPGGGYDYHYENEPRPTCTLTASSDSIEDGEDTTLRWETSHATTVTISYLGTVSHDGSEKVSPNVSRTYSLSASGPGGSVSCTERVVVDDDHDDDTARCDAFDASDTRVEKGDRITLTWRTTDASDVDINQGVGDVEEDGSERVTINRDTTFILTARDGDDTDTCRVTVEIEDDDDDDTNLRCTLNISDTRIYAGQKVKLSWKNYSTDRLILKDSHGKEIADSRDDRDVEEDQDSITVHPSQDTKYTLTVYDGNEKETCTASVDVTDTVTVTGVRAQDGISLSQVPYTGFEAGPILTLIFYGAIGLWGVVIAYVLVIKKAAIAIVATKPIVSTLVASAGISNVVSPVETTPSNLPTEEMVQFVQSADNNSIRTLEAYAHDQYALISSDALHTIVSISTSEEDQIATLNRVIALAKARFPKEGDWIMLNKERILSVLA